MAEFDHLWNDMPFDERKRLTPYHIECAILHIEQAKAIAQRAHAKHMRELNRWLCNLRKSLELSAIDLTGRK